VTRRALEDLKAVVVDYLGGVVAARVRGKGWWRLEEAAALPERELLERVAFYCFLPETWREDRKRKWEARMEDRAHRLGTPAWKVTEDPQEAARARPGLTVAGSGPGLAAAPLYNRLRAARLERGLSLDQVGAFFGVSKMAVSKWEAGSEPDEEGRIRGMPIAADLQPLVLRWVETGEPPKPEELGARRIRRAGELSP
jgi:hypothetical protein